MLLVLLAGCGSMLRASTGPTVDVRGKVGIEVATDVATHLIGTQIAGAPIGLRLQGSAIGGDVVGFIGFAAGDTTAPAFYGRDPTVPDWRTGAFESVQGYAGHLAGAIGATTDGLMGGRVGLGIGRGTARSRDGGEVRHRIIGGEVAWQGDWKSTGDGWDNVRNRITASIYVQWSRLPADHSRIDWFDGGKQ